MNGCCTASVTGIAIDLPTSGDFGAFGAARLAMLADGASVADVATNLPSGYVEPDMALAEKLNSARDEWQQIYQLLKKTKTAIQSDSGDGRV